MLRPGGAFVLVDRFGDASEFGGADELAGVLRATTGLRSESLVATLGVPWPLRTRRALGPVEVLVGQKARREDHGDHDGLSVRRASGEVVPHASRLAAASHSSRHSIGIS